MSRPSNIIVTTIDYKNLAERFGNHQKRLGFVRKSVRSKLNYLCEFLEWLEGKNQLQIEQINAEIVQKYYAHLSHRPSKKDGGKLSQKTTHSHLQNLRDVFEMLLQSGEIAANPCSTLKFPYPKVSEVRCTVSQEEIKNLYEICENGHERAILSLAYGCGLRVSELVNCNVEDVRLQDKILVVPNGKGKKRRVVPLSNGVAQDLRDYFYGERNGLARGRDYRAGEAAFMLNSRGGRMQKWTYNKVLKLLIERTENPKLKEKQITIHHLRHSIATHLLEQGIKVEQVRMFLGHSQLETTQIYTHVSPAKIKNLME